MENPVEEIEGVIRKLTQTPPTEQREAIEKYFLPDASFTHPFCRTGSFDQSRFLIRAIYRWYKIMSPEIVLRVNSVAFDEKNAVLYANIFQIFSIWAIPFHSSHVNLTCVLHLQYDRGCNKYFIKSQEDLYQVDQFVRFVWFGGPIIVMLWQFWATFFCMLGAVALWPISWLEENSGKLTTAIQGKTQKAKASSRALVEDVKSDGLVTAPAVEQR